MNSHLWDLSVFLLPMIWSACLYGTFWHARIGWCTIGWPARGNKGLARLKESGRNLVPVKQAHPSPEEEPPTSIMPFNPSYTENQFQI
jgi:hypothetical protein